MMIMSMDRSVAVRRIEAKTPAQIEVEIAARRADEFLDRNLRWGRRLAELRHAEVDELATLAARAGVAPTSRPAASGNGVVAVA